MVGVVIVGPDGGGDGCLFVVVPGADEIVG